MYEYQILGISGVHSGMNLYEYDAVFAVDEGGLGQPKAAAGDICATIRRFISVKSRDVMRVYLHERVVFVLVAWYTAHKTKSSWRVRFLTWYTYIR